MTRLSSLSVWNLIVCSIALVYCTAVPLTRHDLRASRLSTESAPSILSNPNPKHEIRIIKRTSLVHSFSGLTLTKSSIKSFILPVGPAALALQAFYTRLLHDVLYVWPANTKPVPSFIVYHGAFELAMYSKDNVPIPWDWIAGFASEMAKTSAMGFTSTYELTYTDAAQKFVLGVVMTVKGAAAIGQLVGGGVLVPHGNGGSAYRVIGVP
ncbi:MAG: hypothetical protein Q9220_005559 [cf. Caloplaca sp. 1 TL-2023]